MPRGLGSGFGTSRFALQSSNLKNAETCILDDTRDAIQKQEASRCLDGAPEPIKLQSEGSGHSWGRFKPLPRPLGIVIWIRYRF